MAVANGQWRRLVARFVRDEEVVGSNPACPTSHASERASPSLATIGAQGFAALATIGVPCGLGLLGLGTSGGSWLLLCFAMGLSWLFAIWIGRLWRLFWMLVLVRLPRVLIWRSAAMW